MYLTKFTCGPYTFSLADAYPTMYYSYCQRAELAEAIETGGSSRSLCYLGVERGHGWPFLIVAQCYSPGPQSGFFPGLLFIPETHLLLLGAGERLLAYTLETPSRLWEEDLPGGFWQWERSQDRIIMSSENLLAVWDIHGQKRWEFPVAAPWHYTLEDDTIQVHMDGKQIALHCEHGQVVESTAEPHDPPASVNSLSSFF